MPPLAFCPVSTLQRARRRVRALRQQFERRWKEMWDDATGRPFYHDKNTGEIRCVGLVFLVFVR